MMTPFPPKTPMQMSFTPGPAGSPRAQYGVNFVNFVGFGMPRLARA